MADDGTITDRRCGHCGHPMPEGARFCADCGAPVAAAASAKPIAPVAPVPPAPLRTETATGAGSRRSPVGAATMLGFGVSSPFGEAGPTTLGGGAPPTLGGGSLPTRPDPAPATLGGGGAPPTLIGGGLSAFGRPPAAAAPGGLHRTMLGLAASPVAAPPPPGSATGAPNPAKTGLMPRQTMLGIAMPGIAPLQPMEPVATLPPSVPNPTPRYPALMEATMTTPTHLPSTLFPPPEPLADLPVPTPARVVRSHGVPIATVALVAGAILLVGGLAIAWLWRGAVAITAQPHASPSGEDILHLHCDPRSCRDGTTAEIDGAKSTFAAGECDLTLSEPLHVGDNALAVHIDRPGMGRDEVLKLSVPVAFRVRADPSTMSAAPPRILIRVEARPASSVTIDGKPLPLDANGIGTYAIDESAATDGPADESRVVSVDVPYVVVPAAGPGPTGPVQGTVSARVVVAPLRVDAPSAHAVVDRDHVLVAGRAAKGATVTVGGAPVAVGPEGAFETSVALPLAGDAAKANPAGGGIQLGVEVRAETPALRPRTVHLVLRRVTSLADEARAFERREKTIGYDAATRDLAGAVGRAIVVEGEVIDSRSFGYRSVLLVDDRRGCAKGPCLARVVLDQDLPFPRGTVVRACGHVARPFTAPNGQTVPEVEADFVVPAKR